MMQKEGETVVGWLQMPLLYLQPHRIFTPLTCVPISAQHREARFTECPPLPRQGLWQAQLGATQKLALGMRRRL